jgi:hypothetical protein
MADKRSSSTGICNRFFYAANADGRPMQQSMFWRVDWAAPMHPVELCTIVGCWGHGEKIFLK